MNESSSMEMQINFRWLKEQFIDGIHDDAIVDNIIKEVTEIIEVKSHIIRSYCGQSKSRPREHRWQHM